MQIDRRRVREIRKGTGRQLERCMPADRVANIRKNFLKLV